MNKKILLVGFFAPMMAKVTFGEKLHDYFIGSSYWTPKTAGDIKPTQLTDMNERSLRALYKENRVKYIDKNIMGSLTTEALSRFTTGFIKQLTREQIQQINPDLFSQFTEKQLSAFTNAQWKVMDPIQLLQFTNQQRFYIMNKGLTTRDLPTIGQFEAIANYVLNNSEQTQQEQGSKKRLKFARKADTSKIKRTRLQEIKDSVKKAVNKAGDIAGGAIALLAVD